LSNTVLVGQRWRPHREPIAVRQIQQWGFHCRHRRCSGDRRGSQSRRQVSRCRRASALASRWS